MTDEAIAIIGIVAVLGTLLTIAFLVIRGSRRQELERQEKQQEKTKRLREQGLVNEDGDPLRIICRDAGIETVGTHKIPMTGQRPFSRIEWIWEWRQRREEPDYRSCPNFRIAILFFRGGLDL